MNHFARVRLLLVSVAGLVCQGSVQAAPGPVTIPQAARAGFAPERLERLDAYLQDLVESGRYNGLSVCLVRDGRPVMWHAYGWRDRANHQVLRTNDIFAIASLSKIVTTVGALILVEEGRLTLREPISRFLPAYGEMKVLVGGTVQSPVLTNAARPLTLHDLLTHTAGLSSFDPVTAPLHAQMRQASNDHPQTLAAMADNLARYPLQNQPGTAWVYGPSTDLVGALIERVSGMPFDRFLEQRIFKPLGMRDTGFTVPREKQARQVSMDTRQRDGSLLAQPPKVPGQSWPSGGGGLYSTQADYGRFAQMLLNGGVWERIRILSPKTLELMTQDHLHGLVKPTKIYPVSDGFGYGVEVRTDVARSQWLGSQGTFGWNGATTAYCSIDPREKLVAMIWAQHQPNSEFELFERFNNLVYQALTQLR